MLLGAERLIISSNLVLRLDGLPLAKQRQPSDSGVAVYFVYEGESQCLPCDKWHKVKHNIQAIRLTVEALRGLDRWGSKQMVKAAFAGFKALPEKTSARSWQAVLGYNESDGIETAESRYKTLALLHHPDRPGGNAEKFHELATAIQQARSRFPEVG